MQICRSLSIAGGLWLLTGCLFPASAQISVACRLPAQRFIRHAPINLTVNVVNHSGNTLCLDGGRMGAELRLELERSDGRVIPPGDSAVPVVQAEIINGESRAFTLDVVSAFNLRENGDYTIRAVVDTGYEVFASPDVRFAIVRGFELARLAAGVPGSAGARRLYVLEYLQTDSGENLYLRMEDENAGAVLGMFALGYIVRMRPPEMLLDEAGNIHVLFQTKQAAFIHASFTPHGKPVASETIPAPPQAVMHLELQSDGCVAPTTAPAVGATYGIIRPPP